jgi:hypothetical protein
MAEPLATSGVRSCARQNDAVGVEPFCGVQIGFEQKRSRSQERSLQKGGHGEICGLGAKARSLLLSGPACSRRAPLKTRGATNTRQASVWHWESR